ncbi:MAG: alpha/beta fold hydrolase [Bacteroidota bacterium]
MPVIHALLVGINQYHPQSGVSPLRGCHNDITAWQQLLVELLPDDYLVKKKVLLDDEATYNGLVSGLQEISECIKPGEYFFFAYSGHGSREIAAPEFRRYYPEEWQETLVCYDSRTQEGLDLSDKELAFLLNDISLKGAEITVFFDCCHAGSGTRALEVDILGEIRSTPDKEKKRQLNSYLKGRIEQQLLNTGEITLPNPKHILLAACRRTEKARELRIRRGLFSYIVQNELQGAKGHLSYSDLFQRANFAAKRHSRTQHPTFEPHGFFDSNQGFLGLESQSITTPIELTFDEHSRWTIPIGAVDGLRSSNGTLPEFCITKGDEVVSHAETVSIGLNATHLAPVKSLSPYGKYQASLLSIPAPLYGVELYGEGPWRTAIEAIVSQEKFSHFHFVEKGTHSLFRVYQEGESHFIVRTVDDFRILEVVGDDYPTIADDIVNRLKHLIHWETIIDLNNSNSHISSDDIELILTETETGRRSNDKEIIIEMPSVNGKTGQVPFKLEIQNHHPTAARYCAIFYATSNYGFFPIGYNEMLPPATTAVAWDKGSSAKPIFHLPENCPESLDLFKVLISNQPIELHKLRLSNIPLPERIVRREEDRPRGKDRSIVGFSLPEYDTSLDWRASLTKVKLIKRHNRIGSTPCSLLNGKLRVAPVDSDFSAQISLSSSTLDSRALTDNSDFIEAIYGASEVVSIYDFGGNDTRSLSPINTIEITDWENEDQLIDHPLLMDLSIPLAPNEKLLPASFDGEHILPIGTVDSSTDNLQHTISISHLPATAEYRTRSIIKSVKMVLLKLILKDKGYSLRYVDFTGATPRPSAVGVATKVAESQNILLLVHGIFGNTGAMMEFAQQLFQSKKFDCILAFDYENLATSITETAENLENALLTEANIRPDQQLTILAHSMGGLVSRYLIEKLNNKVKVNRLVMAGTPNAGSALAKITKYRDASILLLGFALNSGWGFPMAASIIAAFRSSKTVTKTLESMNSDSAFLLNLNRSPDPNVDYRIVAGNLTEHLSQHPDMQSLWDKLYRLGGRIFYQDELNDLAVSIESIFSVSSGRLPTPTTEAVACHHLNYFTDEDSSQALIKMLTAD